jgi:hypothetical protein
MAVGFVHLQESLDALIQRTFIIRLSDIGGSKSTFACVIAGDEGFLPVHFAISPGRRSRFERAVLVLRMLRRPMIAPALRPSAAPIAPYDFRAAFNSRRCSSSPWLHGLLLFFGINCPAPKHLLQRKCSVSHGSNLYVCFMFALGSPMRSISGWPINTLQRHRPSRSSLTTAY